MTANSLDISARILAAMRDFALERLPESEAMELLLEAARRGDFELDEIEDIDAWFPLKSLSAMRATLAPKLGESVIEQAFLWAVPRRRDFSAMTFPSIGSPRIFYRHADRSSRFFAQHLEFDVEKLERGRARVAISYREDVPRTRDSCDVARACLASIPVLLQQAPARVKETECYAEGHAQCRYDVRWREFPSYPTYFGLGGGVLAGLGALFSPSMWWLTLPLVGIWLGRELSRYHVQRYMSGILDEQRRALVDNELLFRRRFEELTELKNSLEVRVEERTRELAEARDALQRENSSLREAVRELDVLQDELLAAGLRGALGKALGDFAHEVNNPLSALSIGLSVFEATLDQNDEPEGDAKQRRVAIETMRLGIERVRAVLTWFVERHAEEGQLPQPLDLDAEIRETVGLMKQTVLDGAEVVLDCTAQTFIEAFGRQPVQVITNLLSNAHRAAPGGKVEVRTFEEDGCVVMSVTDDGHGMDEATLNHALERGFTTSADRGGSGLGLYLAKAIVDRHRGKLSISSTPGEGTCVRVEWPLWRGSARAPGQRVDGEHGIA